MNLGERETERAARKGCVCSGKGAGGGRRRAVGREKDEKRKERNHPKRLGRIGVGQRVGALAKRNRPRWSGGH